MIEKDFLESLIRLLDESSLDNLEIERGGTRIRLSKSPDVTGVVPAAVPAPAALPASAPAPTAGDAPAAAEASTAPAAASSPSHLVDVESPMVGTFYRAPAPDAPPYVDVGKQVGERRRALHHRGHEAHERAGVRDARVHRRDLCRKR